jgi:hypothetical protein
MPDVPVDFLIGPDGTTLVARAPSYITDVVTNDATHQLVIAGRPTGDAVAITLPWSGETTAPIPTIPSDPASFWRWNATIAPATRKLYVDIFMGGTASATHTYEVFDGPTLLGTAVLDHQTLSNNTLGFVTDPVLVRRGDSVPIQRWLLGTFTFPTGALSVRVSCPPGANDGLDADDLWVTTTGGADVLRIQPSIPPATYATGPYPYSDDPEGYQVLGQTPNMFVTRGTGVGTRYLLDPSAVRAALEALPSVAPGDVEVAGDGSATNPIRVHFTGALGGVARALMTATPTDGTLAISDYAVGGILPTIRRDGVPVPMPRELAYYPKISRNIRTMFFAFPQPLPAVFKYSVAWQYDNGLSGSWQTAYDGGATYHHGYTDQTYRATGIGPTATFCYRMTPRGTYRVSVTHPVDAAYSTDVVFKVRDVDDNLLGTYHVDQTVAPAGTLDAGVAWKILGTFTLGRSVNGGHMNGLIVTQENATGSEMVADAVRFETVSLEEPTVTFDPEDVVTVSAGRAWLTCTDGPAGAVADAAVENLAGGTIYTPSDAPSACEMGYNVPVPYVTAESYYVDRLYNGEMVRYPTTLGSSFSASITLADAAVTWGGDRKSAASVLPDDYDVLWRGASRLGLFSSFPGGHSEVTGRAIFPGVDAHGFHRRTFTMAGGAFQYGPTFSLTIETTNPEGVGPPYACDLDDVWVVPRDTDVSALAPNAFHPEFLSRIAGLRTLRFLDPLAAIEGNCVDFSDFTDAASATSRNQLPNAIALDLTTCTIRDYVYSSADFAHDFIREFGAAVVFEFAQPLGIKRGQFFHLDDYTGDLAVVSRADDGSTGTVQIAQIGMFAWVISPTKFVSIIANGSGGVGHGGEQHMTNVVTPTGGRLNLRHGAAMPVGEVVEACNIAGANLYFNCCLQATDACLAALGAFLAANLAPGLVVRWEAGNEPWNFTNSVCTYLKQRSWIDYGSTGGADFQTSYVEIAHNQFVRVKAAWVAAGRDPAHFRTVMGGQMFFSDYGRGYAAAFVAKGWEPFDILAVADYMENSTSSAAPGYTRERDLRALVDSLSAAQHVTAYELHRLYGGYEGEVPGHLAAVVAGGGSDYAGTGIGFYEGGFDILMLQARDDDHPGPYPSPNRPYYNHAMQRHPRMYGIELNDFRTFENSGCSFQNIFMLMGSDTRNVEAWGTYRAAGQLPYAPGDPAQDATQVDHVDRQDLIRSIQGGAVAYYASLFGASAEGPSAIVIQDIPPFRNLRALG